MPDQVTNYVIAVADKIDAGIDAKLQRIAASAGNAGSGVAALQQQINKINSSGITSVSQTLRSTSDAQRILTTATTAYGASALTAATRTTTFGNSLVRMTANAQNASASLRNLQSATAGVVGTQQNLTSIVAAANATNTAVNRVGTTATSSSGGVRGFTSTLGLMEGRLTAGNRLAGQFLSTFSFFPAVMRAAFLIAGPVALVAVLAEVGQAIYHVVDAYRAMSLAATKAQFDAIDSGEKIIKVQASLFSAAQAARLVAGRGLDTSTVTITQVAPLIAEANARKEIAAAQRQLNEAGLTGAALQAKRKQDDIEEVANLKQQRDSIQAVADTLRKQGEAQTVTKSGASYEWKGGLQGGKLTFGPKSTNTITDPKQRADILSNYKQATEEVKRLDTAITVMGIHAETAGKKETVAGIKDELKAAREEMSALDTRFKEYVGNLTHKLTPAEGLTWWEHAETGLKHYSDNIDKVQGKEEVYKQQIAARNDKLDNTNLGLDDEITSIGTYNNTLKEKQRLDKLTQEFQKSGQPLNNAETATLQRKIAVIVESAGYQRALGTAYEEAAGPLLTYTAQTRALVELIAKDPAHTAEYAAQLRVATKTYQDAINPLNEYNESLRREAELIGQYGTQLTVSTQLQGIEQTLRARGKSLTDQQTQSIRDQLTVLEQAKQVQADLNAMYNANAGAVEKLNIQQQANNQAYRDGIISADQYRQVALKTAEAQNELANDRGLGNFSTRMTEIFATMTKNYTTFGNGATKAFGQFFTTLADGFADAIGHAVAFGGSVKTALLDVARQAVAGLISSLIKLGIQYLIVTALQKAFGISLPKADANASVKQTAANTVAAIAAITAVTTAEYAAIDLLTAPAWDLAEAVSLFSFGANAAGAEAGITAVVAAGQAAQHFATGGPVRGPGSAVSDSIPARLSNGEYVVNAHATSQNYGLLDAINNGGKVMHYASGGYVAGTQLTQQTSGMQGGVNVNIVHDGSTAIEVVQGPTASDMQIIAKNAVYQHADDAIAGAVGNGNSRTRQSLHQNTSAAPRRN